MEPTVNADGISMVHLSLVSFNDDSKLHSTVTAFHTAYTTMQPLLLGTDIPFQLYNILSDLITTWDIGE